MLSLVINVWEFLAAVDAEVVAAFVLVDISGHHLHLTVVALHVCFLQQVLYDIADWPETLSTTRG